MFVACAGWGTILVMVDVTLSVFSVILYIAMTYHPLNVSLQQNKHCGSNMSSTAAPPAQQHQRDSSSGGGGGGSGNSSNVGFCGDSSSSISKQGLRAQLPLPHPVQEHQVVFQLQ